MGRELHYFNFSLFDFRLSFFPHMDISVFIFIPLKSCNDSQNFVILAGGISASGGAGAGAGGGGMNTNCNITEFSFVFFYLFFFYGCFYFLVSIYI